MRQFMKTCLLALVLVIGLTSLANAQNGKPKQRDPYSEWKFGQVNYRDPPREYETIRMHHGNVMVEKQLLTDAPDTAKAALERLDRQWRQALEALPRSSHSYLRKVGLFLMYGPKAKHGGNTTGAIYTPRGNPTHFKELDPLWDNSVTIYSAERFAADPESYSLTLLVHEFAHAYHHSQQWTSDCPNVYQAWARASESGLYRNLVDDRGAKVQEGHAIMNPSEYFAVLSNTYFVGNWNEPFNRKELKTYDPAGYAMIEKMWGVTDGKEKPATVDTVTKAPAKVHANASQLTLSSLAKLLGKNINSKELQAFRDSMGTGPTAWKSTKDGAGWYSEISSNGLKLEFQSTSQLQAIWLLPTGDQWLDRNQRFAVKEYRGELPLGLSFDDTRADVERKLVGSTREGLGGGYYRVRVSFVLDAQVIMRGDRQRDTISTIVIRRPLAPLDLGNATTWQSRTEKFK